MAWFRKNTKQPKTTKAKTTQPESTPGELGQLSVLLPLEQRFMFDAAIAATAAEVAADVADAVQDSHDSPDSQPEADN